MYNPEDDGSALDAAAFIKMRDALIECVSAIDHCRKTNVLPFRLAHARLVAATALEHIGVKT